jgi:bacterioferritin (cytochrome b1)
MSDPDPMDVPEVLDRLGDALRLQYRSVLHYLLVSGGGRGFHAMAIGEQLARYAEDELADARLLISKIVALGGRPVTEIAPLAYEPEVKDGLRALIKTEEETLAALHAVIPPTGQEPGSEALEHLIEHLIMRKQNQVDFLIRAADE